MQMQLDVNCKQEFTDYAEHLIHHVMQHSKRNRNQAAKYSDENASNGWRNKNAEFKKYQDLEA